MQQVDGYIAGIDYPAYPEVPKGLSFSCRGRLPGYYAVGNNYKNCYLLTLLHNLHSFSDLINLQDVETRCQVTAVWQSDLFTI